MSHTQFIVREKQGTGFIYWNDNSDEWTRDIGKATKFDFYDAAKMVVDEQDAGVVISWNKDKNAPVDAESTETLSSSKSKT